MGHFTVSKSEDAASGQSLLQELRSNTALPIQGVKPDSDKHSRASYATPMIEGRQFRLLEGAAWSTAYLEELTAFPGAAHDDFVDATVQALTHLRDSPEPNVLVYYRGLAEADRTQLQKVREQWPGISDSELRRHSLVAGFCQLWEMLSCRHRHEGRLSTGDQNHQ